MQSSIDEQPVGKSGGAPSDYYDEFANPTTSTADNSGPLEQRIQSKNWSIRANAFEELANLFKMADSEFSQDFKDHASMWKKYLNDANPGSLEKCLEALEAFINRADPKVVTSAQNDIIKVLIEKCIGHPKASIKTKGIDCFNLLFEVSEQFEESLETMTESLNSKNAKISQSALFALNSWIATYGLKKVKTKSFLPIIDNAAASSNPSIRNEAMNFYKECFKAMGDLVKPLLQNLKKQQIEDLEKEFAEMKDKPKQEYRVTRSEQRKKKEQVIKDIIMQEEEEKKEDEINDLIDPADILSKFNNEWIDKIQELKAWKEKKDLLDELFNATNFPKIQPGDFSGLVKVLKKMIGDANLNVSQTAIKICGNLARALRKDFETSCKELFPSLIAKFKEKKTAITDDVNAVLENFLLCTNIENISSEIVASLSDKSPLVKRQVCLYLEKAAQKTFIDVLQRVSGEMLQVLIKLTDDATSDVRDAVLQAIGIFKGRLGETAMSKFLQDLNPQKLSKVNESAIQVKPSKFDLPEKQEKKPEPPKPAQAKKTTAPPKKAPPKKQVEENLQDENQAVDFNQPYNVEEKKISPKDNYYDEDIPIRSNNGGFEEKPLGGAKGGGYNLDNLDELEAFGSSGMNVAPKKQPPARLQQKKKEEARPDVEMKDETEVVKQEPKKTQKQPPEPKPKPQAAAKTTTISTKGPSAPQIQEEDIGTGLSKEEAEAKVLETFPQEITSKFEEAKWQDKVEGLKGLGEKVTEMSPGQDVIEAVVKFVKNKMKDWKESNINLVKETIALFSVIASACEKVNRRAVACAMPFLSDKIGDVKMTQSVFELLLKLSELVTPKYIELQVIKYAAQAKSPNTLKESCNILIRLVDEFGLNNLSVREMIDYTILAANHTNPQVRTAAMALFAIMYQHAGDGIKNFMKDIKESTMKLIEEEFAKVTPFKKGEYKQKRNFRGEAAAAQATEGPKKGGGAQGVFDDFPRQDISKQLNSKLMGMFKHADWKVRKEAAEKVEEMCNASQMRIQPTGLNELMDNVKQRMADPNKAVLKQYIQLMGVLVEALGPGAKQFQKKLLPGMLATLADKQSLVRQDAINCMDKWGEHVGPEVVINNVGPMLAQENPELRTEALKWIIKNNEAIKTSELKEIVKPLVSCLSDKAPAIRTMAEEVCCYVMPCTGYQAFQAVLSDLLPAVSNSIKPILEKVKQKVGPISNAQDQMMSSSGAQKQPAPAPTTQTQNTQAAQPGIQKQNSIKPQVKPKTQGSSTNVAQGGGLVGEKKQQNLNQSLQPGMLKRKENQTPLASKTQQRSESKESAKPRGFAQTISSFKPAQQQDEAVEGISITFGFKERRQEIDRKSKFQLEDIKADQIDKLKQLTIQSIGQTYCNKMFSNDFKQHIECIDAFTSLMGEQSDQLLEVLDIIFKWSLVRLADSSNTKFAVSIFDFFSGLFQHLEELGYQLWDFEAQIIIPLLCEKTGLNNNILKEKVKKLIKMIYGIYDIRKTYLLMVQYGLQSKNMRTQAECLDELAEFLIRFGIDYCSEKEMKIVAKLADNNDKSIRENSLKFMGEAYKLLDDNIWRAIGDVTPKVQGLLEQRFKKLKQGSGLQASASQSSFIKPESQNLAMGIREQSPKGLKEPLLRTQTSFGVKKSIQMTTEMGKSSMTPRSGLQFQKPGAQKPENPALSKSINQFNQSNKSNEDAKKTPQNVSKKAEMLKKVQSQDQSASAFAKKMIPQTQRPMDTNTDFVQRNSDQHMKQSFGFRQQAQAVIDHQPKVYGNDVDDDDEDLRILTRDENFGQDPEVVKAQEEITKHIHQLKYADLSKRVDSLVSLNEMITAIEQNKAVLVKTANDLISAFTHVLNDIFDKPVEDIPLRFAKYFITIVLKTCSCKEIMKEVSEEKVFDLAEQLLTRLLIENLDKVGDNKEGEMILKNLNSSMLRLLENCNHTYIFCVLFNLLRKYKDYGMMPKLPNLIIKCLLKLSKILEKLIDRLDMEKILLAIHEYLILINHDNKTQNDEMGIRIIKTVVNELVKLKRDSIWEAYNVIQCHNTPDNHIYKWIQIILKSLQTQGGTPQDSGCSTHTSGDFEMRQIVEELRNPEKFESTIPKLHSFLERNPHIDLNEYVHECSKTFQQFLKANLENYKQKKQNHEFGMMDSMKSTSNSDSLGQTVQPQDPLILPITQSNKGSGNRISEYQEKLASIRMKNQRSGAETATNKQQSSLIGQGSGAAQNLNTSFSAMNSSLSQKWHEINKKSAFTKRDGVQQMSNTMGGFGSALQSSQLETKIGMGANDTQQPMNQSIGAGSGGEQSVGGATNQELNKRLQEMKAKLQAIKKKN